MRITKQYRERRKRKASKRFSLESLYSKTQEVLTTDLGESLIRRTYVKDRLERVAPSQGMPPYLFKKSVQLHDFDKRIIWKRDRSFETLSDQALCQFRKDQSSFGFADIGEDTELNEYVKQSKDVIAKILGEFDFQKYSELCAFGRRAAVGLPRSAAYLDIRFERLSGTYAQIEWFKAISSGDPHLLRAVRKHRNKKRGSEGQLYKIADIQSVTTVPKSFKAARVIAPDTIIGGFLSRGLGNYVRSCLEAGTHIDLAVQQQRHKRWARVSSVSGHLATIDMSKASDSFTWKHVEYLVPESWHGVIRAARGSGTVDVGGEEIELRSLMLMGSGHTFPLQTLLFYALCEGVRLRLKERGRVSVYGDDIIVPTRIVEPCMLFLQRLGFQINSEKSFFDAPDPLRPSHTFFRESCGGDYKGGVDVRPFRPEINFQEIDLVPVNQYIAHCYKLINGLLNRWSVGEVEKTISFLLRTVSSLSREILFVPSDEPDYSGIQHVIHNHMLDGFVYSVPHVSTETWLTIYTKLVRKTQTRGSVPQRQRCYYWYSLWKRKNPSTPLWDDGATPAKGNFPEALRQPREAYRYQSKDIAHNPQPKG